ncbi:MAG: hypothetical protein ACK47F_05290 [Flavobacteriales bacterium]
MKQFLATVFTTFFLISGLSQNRFDTLYYESGDIYIGEVMNEMPNGSGKMVCGYGASYKGEWKNTYQHGKGKMIWPSGDNYSGEWIYGVQNGKGIMNWSNGDHYEGMSRMVCLMEKEPLNF